ncbi:ABC transporter ATP-binding protein [Neobacillus sp. FSL H8-0543]|uniref:ABC transporter ATP-binding protein n=1 Tax=Neobacillus sp. FSL H8-0543 TaxID=2954672 RepID=UPI0031581F2C
MEKAVVITGMTKQYSNGRGIKNINLTINQGEIIGVLGPNGAGKTTLLKCMTGLIQPDSGSTEIFGIDLQHNYKKAIDPVGALIGSAVAYENMTPYQNLKMISRFYSNVQSSDIDEVLQQTGLSPYKNEKISSFSMGMKQRFGIASALLSKPRLIILDEPTNGLDIDGLLTLRKAIQEIARHSRVTFVISSHHISELEKLCNRFCFLIHGQASFYEANEQSLEEIYVKKVEESAYEHNPSK